MLTVAVLAYNRYDLLPDCLNSIYAQNVRIDKILIVDNGSNPPLSSLVKTDHLKPKPKWVVLKENRGHIMGQNTCFAFAEEGVVLFVANDVRLASDCLGWMVAAYNTQPYYGFPLMPVLRRTDLNIDSLGLKWHWPGYGLQLVKPGRPDACPGTCYMMPRWLWEKMGGFDMDLKGSHEDVDFALTLKEHQFGGPRVVKNAMAVHLVNQTLGRTQKNPSEIFRHDRRLVIRKHYRGLDRLARLAAMNIADPIHATLLRGKSLIGRRNTEKAVENLPVLADTNRISSS